MLQTKSILFTGEENINIYSEIINKVSREYDEFSGYKINEVLNGLILEFNVHNKYRGLDLTFINEIINVDDNLSFKLNYFNNDKFTDIIVSFTMPKENRYELSILRNEKAIETIVVLRKKDKYDLYIENYFDNNELISTEENILPIDVINLLTNQIGEKVGYIISRKSKKILLEGLTNYLGGEKIIL